MDPFVDANTEAEADSYINELLVSSETNATRPDDAYVLDQIRNTLRAAGHDPKKPIDIQQLKAMVQGMLHTMTQQNASGDPNHSRNALRLKLQQKRNARLSKHAINAQTEKRTKSTPQPDDVTAAT